MDDLNIQAGVTVNAEQAERAFTNLGDKAQKMANEVTKAADKAGKATDGMGDGAEKSADKFTRAESLMRAAIMKSTRELELLGKTASQRFEAQIDFKGLEKAKFQEAISGLQAMESALSVAKAREAEFAAQNGFSLKAAQAKELVKASEYARWWAQELEKVEAAEKRLAGQNSFINSLKSQADAIGKTKADLLEMQAAQMGVATQAAPFIAKMREAEAGVGKIGVSAAQTAAALRGVPAQFTDIITSLQGGQAPLTVFLQQGGQLKDMFGGAGNAARALGGYVLGLVNPFTIAAAAVAGIAVAYNQGAKEADAYRAALITTGNAAGTNAAQLKSYAQEISSVVGTQGKAAEALSALAATGKVGAENLREAAQAAVAYERATGQAAGKTSEQFASLRNEPLAAVLKLNDGMNFLTDSTYKQIKSLEEQGKTAEAANVAQRAFADTLSGRAGEMERNLGTVERGWLAVKDAAKSAWDAILNVGRASTSVDQLSDVRKQIAARENQLANDGFGSNGGGAAFGRPSSANSARLSAELTALKAQAAALEGVAFASKTAAEAERQRGESVKASAAFDKAGERFLTDKVKMERELAVARTQGAEAGRSQAEIEKRLGEIRASYAKKGGGGGVAAENKELRDQQRIFAELAGVSSTYYAELANAQKQRAAGVITEQQYVTAVQSLIEKQPFAVALAKEEAAATQALSKSYAEAAAERIKTIQSMERAADSLQSQNDALREEIELIGLSTEQQTLVLQQRNDVIILTKEATLAELERQSAITGTQTRVEIALASEIEALKERNALLGAKGVKNAAVDAAKSAADEWQKTTDSINQSLTDSLMRGFESGKDFAKNLRDTVINMFKTMVLRPVISAVLAPVAGLATGAANAMTGGGGGGGLMGMASNANSLYNAGMGGNASLMFSDFGMGLTNSVYSAGGALTNMGLDSLGSSVTSFANSISGFSDIMTTAGDAFGYASSIFAAADGKWGQAAGSAIGTYFGGPIGSFIGSTIGSAVDNIFSGDSGTLHTGGAAQYSAATGLRTSLGFRDNEEGLPSYNPNDNIDNQFGTGFGWSARSDQTISAVSGIAQGLSATLDGVAVAFGEKAGYAVATAFADDTSKDGAWGALRISKDGQDLLNWNDTRTSRWAPKEFANGEDGYKEYLAAVAKDTRQVLLDMDLPSWADTMLESIGDAANMDQLAATVQQIGVIQTTFVQLGKTMEGFAGLTDKAFEAIMRASGGFESLAANAGTYYENFYSEAEKTAAVTRSVSDALAQFGLAMPATRDEFRALVESQLAMGEAGAEAVAALLGVSGAFANTADYFEQAAQAAKETADVQIKAAQDAARAIAEAYESAMGRIGSARFDLENQLLTQSGQGQYAQQLTDQRDLAELTKGLPEEQAAKVREQFEANLKLRDQYEANQLAADNLAKAMEEMERQQNAAAQAQRSMLQGTATSAQNAVTQLKSIFDTLDNAIASLRGSVTSAAEQDSRAAREYIAQASVLMRSGSVVDSGKLSAAVRSATAGIDNQSFANSNEADFERLKLAGELAGLQDSTAGQLTVAEQHLSIAESQLAALEYIASSISSLAGAQQAAAGQPRDQWSTVSGQQVYASSGGAVGVNTGSDIDIYGKDGSLFTGSEAIAFVRNQVAVNDEASVYAEAVRTGISSKALDELMGWAAGTSNDWAKANQLPQFAIGTNYVPRDMVAQIHEGEAIVPKAFNPWAGGGGGSDNAQLLQELRALRAEVAQLNAATQAGADAAGATADVLVRVTNNGNGMVTAAAPI